MKFYTVDVMIPTYKPGQEFAELLPRLLEQTYPIRSIRVVNTGKKFWNPAWEQLSDKIMVEHIRPSELTTAEREGRWQKVRMRIFCFL